MSQSRVKTDGSLVYGLGLVVLAGQQVKRRQLLRGSQIMRVQQ